MTISYVQDWHPTEGTHYDQRITMTEEEVKKLGLHYHKGINYLHLHGLYNLAALIYKYPEYSRAHKRILDRNTIVFVK